MATKKNKPKQKYLLMEAQNAIEPWVAVAAITEDLIEKVKKMRALFLLTEPFELNLTEIAARDIGATYYQPKVVFDGSYKVMTKRPVFKVDDEQRTSCDELVVNGSEIWWRCFDHYDEMSQVISTERVKIDVLMDAWDPKPKLEPKPFEEQALELVQNLQMALGDLALPLDGDRGDKHYLRALEIAKGNIVTRIQGITGKRES